MDNDKEVWVPPYVDEYGIDDDHHGPFCPKGRMKRHESEEG